jgi:hypothetical protein
MDQIRPVFASAVQRLTQNPGKCDTHERRADIGSVVHVLTERHAAVGFPPANQIDGIDIKQQGKSAYRFGRHRIKDMRGTKRQQSCLTPKRILVQQISQIRCRHVCCRQG